MSSFFRAQSKYIFRAQMAQPPPARKICPYAYMSVLVSRLLKVLKKTVSDLPISHLQKGSSPFVGRSPTHCRCNVLETDLISLIIFFFFFLLARLSLKNPKVSSFQIGSGWNLAGLFFDWRSPILIWRPTFTRWQPGLYFTHSLPSSGCICSACPAHAY